MEEDKVAVSRRAVVQRVNRKLASQGQRMVAARSERVRQELGSYYVIDLNSNTVVWKRFDLAAYAQKLGALKTWERVEDDEKQ
jgi:hypothetical protein